MDIRYLVSVLTICALAGSVQARAQEALVTHKALSPGGLIVESGCSLVGAIGVSGAPGEDADEACAKAGVEAIQGKLDF